MASLKWAYCPPAPHCPCPTCGEWAIMDRVGERPDLIVLRHVVYYRCRGGHDWSVDRATGDAHYYVRDARTYTKHHATKKAWAPLESHAKNLIVPR